MFSPVLAGKPVRRLLKKFFVLAAPLKVGDTMLEVLWFFLLQCSWPQQMNLALCWSAKALEEFPGFDTELWLIFILQEGSGETESLGSCGRDDAL